MQTTLKSLVTFKGVGLHSGAPVIMSVTPAALNHGIWFHRTDVRGCDAFVPARWDAVNPTPLCTKIQNADGTTVSTIEHIMAALAGCGITNALIEIDGAEVPIMDGSSAEFVRGLLAKGVQRQSGGSWALRILKDVEVKTDNGWARLEPARSLSIDFAIEFEDAAIGVQRKSLNMANGTFVRELCDSRTFCRNSDVEAMHAMGLAKGGTLENAVVVDGDRILSPGGLRHADEAVRHKMLDALGDLSLAGAPILGRYTGMRAGHAMTNALLRALFADPSAYEMVDCDASINAHLPGAGVTRSEIPAIQ
ncbi:UDP-3-O-acyl-N-acetylglucosamine deacetylase [Planktotalea arctica]|uniref:UDP-3-O-acyl-N-acetylglucosamine deacetylase n=1 Tax=Planktotalea arctica TaxID=1481893 RepID=UPI00321BE64B